jgi:hypothetical protein
MPPFETIVMSMKSGNTSATPAMALVPRKLTNQVSATPTNVCNASTTRIGHARPRSVGAIGASRTAVRFMSVPPGASG